MTISTPRRRRWLAGREEGWQTRRYLIMRRTTQAAVLALFFGTLHYDWTVGSRPILAGNLSGSTLLGTIPLADPLAALQILFTGTALFSEVLLGGAIVLLFYGVVGGRVFCSWVCPVNPVTDLAAWLRRRLGLRGGVRLSRTVRLWALGLTLALSAITGIAAFELISPIGMFHRSLIFGLGTGWTAVLVVFLLDLFVVRNGWCGHLCPLGAFWGLVGRVAQIRVRFEASKCTHCGDCFPVCPEPHVLDLGQAAEVGMIASGDCTNCGRCIPVCPEGSLGFDLRPRIMVAKNVQSSPSGRRAA